MIERSGRQPHRRENDGELCNTPPNCKLCHGHTGRQFSYSVELQMWAWVSRIISD
jgi:hypothetical protein